MLAQYGAIIPSCGLVDAIRGRDEGESQGLLMVMVVWIVGYDAAGGGCSDCWLKVVILLVKIALKRKILPQWLHYLVVAQSFLDCHQFVLQCICLIVLLPVCGSDSLQPQSRWGDIWLLVTISPHNASATSRGYSLAEIFSEQASGLGCWDLILSFIIILRSHWNLVGCIGLSAITTWGFCHI